MRHTLIFFFALGLMAGPCRAQMQPACTLFDAGFFTTGWGGTVETPDGGAVICGGYDQSNSGHSDVVLTKVDASGALQWMKTYSSGQTTSEYGMAIINTSDGGLAVAGTEHLGRAYIMKLGQDGVPEWTKAYAGTGYNLQMPQNGFVQLADGGFALNARTLTGIDGWMMLRTDASGNVLWSDKLEYNGIGADVAALPNGDLVFNGDNGSFNAPHLIMRKDGLTGATEWMHWYAAEANGSLDVTGLVVGPDSTIVMGGSAGGLTYGDAFAFAVSADGTLLWSTRIGGTIHNESARDIVWHPSGGYVLVGQTQESVAPYTGLGGFAARLDVNGQAVWGKFLDHPDVNALRPWRCSVTSDGGVLLTGETGTPTNYPQFFIKLGADGNVCPYCTSEDVGTANALNITPAPDQGTAFPGPWAMAAAGFSFTVSDITPTVEGSICGTTGVEELPSGPSVTLAPNPFTDHVVITLDHALMTGQAWIEVRDLPGRLVHTQRLHGNTLVLERGPLNTGAYSYRIADGSGTLATGVLQIADR